MDKRIVDGYAPAILENYFIHSLDIGALVADTKYYGDFEKLLKASLGTIKHKNNAISSIDEIHTAIGADSVGDSSMNSANLLKLFLVSGDLKYMGSTIFQEYSCIF